MLDLIIRSLDADFVYSQSQCRQNDDDLRSTIKHVQELHIVAYVRTYMFINGLEERPSCLRLLHKRHTYKDLP